VIDGDVAAEITRLKQAPGKNIVQYGFGVLSRLLLEHGLLDELRLWVHPLIVGAGRPSDLLFGAAPAVGFDLTDATTLSDGTVILSYDTGKMLPRAA
jgi:dihydrofolate reductase